MKKKQWLILMVVLLLSGTGFIAVATIQNDPIICPGVYYGTRPPTLYLTTAKPAFLFTELDSVDLDQSQEERGGSVIIGYPQPGYYSAQEVVNDRPNMVGFSFLLKTNGIVPTAPLYFGIMKTLGDPTKQSSWYTLHSKTYTFISDWTWLATEYDPPLDISAGESFYIVLVSESDPNTDGWWQWGCSSEETYNGNTLYWDYPRGWTQSTGLDMCFRTYTEEDTPPPPPPPPPPSNVWLEKGITCGYVGDACGDEGPEKTDFIIGEDIYAYSKFSCSGGYDFYGKIMKHEWFYNGEPVWEWSKRTWFHYTDCWCGWTWWDIGSDLGPGQGIVKFYLDGAYMGSTELFNVIDPSPPPPDPPSISITANSWVVIGQVSSVFCWIGAAISGFKGIGLI